MQERVKAYSQYIIHCMDVYENCYEVASESGFGLSNSIKK